MSPAEKGSQLNGNVRYFRRSEVLFRSDPDHGFLQINNDEGFYQTQMSDPDSAAKTLLQSSKRMFGAAGVSGVPG